MSNLREEAKRTKVYVLYDEAPGLFDKRFLLREQLIGEQRGLERPQELVDLRLRELAESEKQQNTDNESATEPE